MKFEPDCLACPLKQDRVITMFVETMPCDWDAYAFLEAIDDDFSMHFEPRWYDTPGRPTRNPWGGPDLEDHK